MDTIESKSSSLDATVLDSFDSIILRHSSPTRTVRFAPDVDLRSKDDYDRNKVIKPTSSNLSNSSASTTAIPPKISLHLYVQEEASVQKTKVNSTILIGDLKNSNYFSSQVHVTGSIHAKVQSSDASKNHPFTLSCVSSSEGKTISLSYNTNLIVSSENKDKPQSQFVQIPKSLKGQVLIANYNHTFTKQFMPLLVNSKVERTGVHNEKCLVAVQIRSSLHGNIDIRDLTLAVAIPSTIVGDSVKGIRGDNVSYDELRRILKWKFPMLPKGETLLVEAEMELISQFEVEVLPTFPVILRCHAMNELMSDVEVTPSYNPYPPIKALSVIQHKSFTLWYRTS